MFAIFHKSKFAGWWGNSRHDLSWIGLTVLSQGWLPADVDVVRFDQAPQSNDVYTFNDDKAIVMLNRRTVTIDEVEKEIFEPGTTVVGELVHDKGNLI